MEEINIKKYIETVTKIAKINNNNILRWVKNFNKILVVHTLLFLKITIRKNINTFWGGKMQVILPERVSVSIWRNTFFDENVTTFLLNYIKAGDVMIDVGAHYGFYSLLGSYLAGNAGKVIAFEPTPSTFQQLKFNVENFASSKNIIIYNLALYSKKMTIDLNDYGIINSAYNTLGNVRTTANLKKTKYSIRAVTLDELLNEEYPGLKIDLVKIDAESVELKILQGFTETLNKQAPKVILEVGDVGEPNSKSIELIKYLINLNYRAYEYHNGFIIEHRILNNYNYDNLIFIKE